MNVAILINFFIPMLSKWRPILANSYSRN